MWLQSNQIREDCKFDELSVEQRIRYSHLLFVQEEENNSQILKGLITVERIDNDYKLITNEGKELNDPRKGFVNVRIPEQFVNQVGLINLDYDQALLNYEYNQPHSFDEKIPANCNQRLKQEIREISKQCIDLGICLNKQLYSKPEGYYPIENKATVKSISEGVCRTICIKDNLKTGDTICIKQRDKTFVIRRVKRHKKWMLINYNMPGKGGPLRYYLPRQSLTSLILQLNSLLITKEDTLTTIKLLSKANTILAVPGWGKSTQIAANFTPDTTVVCVTSEAVKNLINMGIPRGNVKSVERATEDRITTKRLIVDECTQVDWMRIHEMVTDRVQEIELFGDSFQIGTVDFSGSSGERTITSCNMYSDNVKQFNSTRRFGEPLCSELKTLNPNIDTIASHETTYNVENLSELNTDRIAELINKHHIGVVLTFHQLTKNILQKALGKTNKVNLNVTDFCTVHSFQGNQKSRVMVIQHFLTPSGVHTDKRYLMSAASRCTNHLTWVTIDSPVTSLILKDHLKNTILIGGMSDNILDNVTSMIRKKYNNISILGILRTCVQRLLGEYEQNRGNAVMFKVLSLRGPRVSDIARGYLRLSNLTDEEISYYNLIQLEIQDEVGLHGKLFEIEIKEEESENHLQHFDDEKPIDYYKKTVTYFGNKLKFNSMLLPGKIEFRFFTCTFGNDGDDIKIIITTKFKSFTIDYDNRIGGFKLTKITIPIFNVLEKFGILEKIKHINPFFKGAQLFTVEENNEEFNENLFERNVKQGVKEYKLLTMQSASKLNKHNEFSEVIKPEVTIEKIRGGKMISKTVQSIVKTNISKQRKFFSYKIGINLEQYSRLTIVADSSRRFFGGAYPVIYITPYGWIEYLMQDGCSPCAGLFVRRDEAWWLIDNDYLKLGSRRIQFNEECLTCKPIIYFVKTLNLDSCFTEAYDYELKDNPLVTVNTTGIEPWEQRNNVLDFIDVLQERLCNMDRSTLTTKQLVCKEMVEYNDVWLLDRKIAAADDGIELVVEFEPDELSVLDYTIMLGRLGKQGIYIIMETDNKLFCPTDETGSISLDSNPNWTRVKNLNELIRMGIKLAGKNRASKLTNLLRHVNNGLFGSNDLEDGLILDLDQHKFNKTAVYNHLCQRLGELKLSQSSMIRRPFYHGKISDSRLLNQLKNVLRCGVIMECPTTMGTSTGSELVMLVLAHMEVKQCTLVLKNPGLLLSNSLWHHEVLSLTEILVEQDIPSERKIFQDHCGHIISKVSNSMQSYTSAGNDNKTNQLKSTLVKLHDAIINTNGVEGSRLFPKIKIKQNFRNLIVNHFILMEPEKLKNVWLDDDNEITIIIPSCGTNNSFWYGMSTSEDKNFEVHETNGNISAVISQKKLRELKNLDKLKLFGHYRPIFIAGSLFDYIIVKTQRESNTLSKKYWRTHPLTETIQVPLLTTDLEWAIENKTVMKWKTFTCDKAVLRRLEIRANREGTNFKDLCEFGRTLLHSRDYSRVGSWDSVEVDAFTMLTHCQYAYYKSITGQQSVKQMINLLSIIDDKPGNSSIFKWLKKIGFEKVFAVGYNKYKELIQTIGFDLTLQDSMIEFCGFLDSLVNNKKWTNNFKKSVTEYLPKQNLRSCTFLYKENIDRDESNVGKMLGGILKEFVWQPLNKGDFNLKDIMLKGLGIAPNVAKANNEQQNSKNSEETFNLNFEGLEELLTPIELQVIGRQPTLEPCIKGKRNLLIVSQGTRGDVEPLKPLIDEWSKLFITIYVCINQGNEESIKWNDKVKVVYINMDGSDLSNIATMEVDQSSSTKLHMLRQLTMGLSSSFKDLLKLDNIGLVISTSHTVLGQLIANARRVKHVNLQLFPWAVKPTDKYMELVLECVSRVLNRAVDTGCESIAELTRETNLNLILYPPSILNTIPHGIGTNIKILARNFSEKKCRLTTTNELIITMGSIVGKEALSRYKNGLLWASVNRMRKVYLIGAQFSERRGVETKEYIGKIKRKLKRNGVEIFIATYEDFSEISSRHTIVIHHGGAGTSNYFSRLGIKQIILPIFNDQWLWANYLQKEGFCISSTPFGLRNLNLNTLIMNPNPSKWARLNQISEPTYYLNDIDLLDWVNECDDNTNFINLWPYIIESIKTISNNITDKILSLPPLKLMLEVATCITNVTKSQTLESDEAIDVIEYVDTFDDVVEIPDKSHNEEEHTTYPAIHLPTHIFKLVNDDFGVDAWNSGIKSVDSLNLSDQSIDKLERITVSGGSDFARSKQNYIEAELGVIEIIGTEAVHSGNGGLGKIEELENESKINEVKLGEIGISEKTYIPIKEAIIKENKEEITDTGRFQVIGEIDYKYSVDEILESPRLTYKGKSSEGFRKVKIKDETAIVKGAENKSDGSNFELAEFKSEDADDQLVYAKGGYTVPNEVEQVNIDESLLLESELGEGVIIGFCKPPLSLNSVMDWQQLLNIEESNLIQNPYCCNPEHSTIDGGDLIGQRLQNTNILYNPLSDGACTYDCLYWIFNGDGNGILKTWGAIFHSRTWATIADIKGFSYLSGISIIVQTDNECLFLNPNCLPLFALSMETKDGLGHTSVIGFDVDEFKEKQWIRLEKPLKKANLDLGPTCKLRSMRYLGTSNCKNHCHITKQNLGIIGKSLTFNSSKEDIVRWLEIASLISGKTIKDIASRLNGRNWSKLLNRRKTQFVKLVDHQYSNGCSWDLYNCGFRPGDVLCAINGSNISVGVLINRTNDLFLSTSSQVTPVQLVMSLSMNLSPTPYKIPKTINYVGEVKSFFLNRSSMNYCHSIGIKTDVDKIAELDISIDELLISEYDNRQHHLMKDKEIVKQVDESKIVVIGHAERMLSCKWIKTDSKIRPVTIHGKQYIECDTECQLILFCLDKVGERKNLQPSGYRWIINQENLISFRICDTLGELNRQLQYTDDNKVVLTRVKFNMAGNLVKQLKTYLIKNEFSEEGENYILELESVMMSPQNTWDVYIDTHNINYWLESLKGKIDYKMEQLYFVTNQGFFSLIGPMVITKKKLFKDIPELVGGYSQIKQLGSQTWDHSMQDLMKTTSHVKHGFKFNFNNEEKIQSRLTQLSNHSSQQRLHNVMDLIDNNLQTKDNIQPINIINWENLAIQEGFDSIIPKQIIDTKLNRNITNDSIQEVPIHVRNMWDDTELLGWNTAYAPTNDLKLKAHIPVGKRRTERKITMCKYPIESRVVLTKVANQEFNAITGRVGNASKIRKYDLNIEYEIKNFCEAYFKEGWIDIVRGYQANPIYPTGESILKWLLEKPDCIDIDSELKMYMEDGFLTHPISDVNVHLKLESLLKDEPVTVNEALKARVIIWQAKGICAMYSSSFIEIKKRLKNLLRPEIIYTDGMQPHEIGNNMNSTGEFEWFLEDDLTRQDSQTDGQTINVEFGLYDLLGLHRGIASSWRRVHENWRFKGKDVRGIWKEMRLTGQATTALGNALVNLTVHWRVVKQLGRNLRKMLILGDDSLFMNTTTTDYTSLRRNIADYYNMKSKAFQYKNHGTFCSMIAYRNNDNSCGIGPDFVRLKRRFEIPSGASDGSLHNIIARKMSYAMMLGDLQPVREIVERMKWPIELESWYDYGSLVDACSSKYDISTTEVEAYLKTLIDYLKQDFMFEVEFDVISQR